MVIMTSSTLYSHCSILHNTLISDTKISPQSCFSEKLWFDDSNCKSCDETSETPHSASDYKI